MRLVLTFGRVTIFDFTLFQVDDPLDKPDVVVVHHYDDDEDKPETDGPDMFGSR